MIGTGGTRSGRSERTRRLAAQLLSGSWPRYAEGGAVFIAAMAFLFALAPSAPFAKELGICESGAVRDVLAGNLILPRFLPGPIVHVPPLYWWTAALCVKAVGWNELALRMPSLIAAALTCAIVFGWTAQAISRRAGWWSAATLLCCHFFLDAARQPRMDSMLALFVTAAVTALERALSLNNTRTPLASTELEGRSTKPISPVDGGSQYPPTVENDARPHPHKSGSAELNLILAAAFLGLGALTKGILGIVLPGLVVGMFVLVRGRFRELFRFKLIAAFGAGFAIGLTWFAAGYELGGRAFVEWQLRMNLWSRFLPPSAGGAGYCAHPFWYFAPKTLSGFLPWSFYLPAFAFAAWRARGRHLPEPVIYVLCWFTALFVFFSASEGKCLVYILPAFPPIAILTGWTLAAAQDRGKLRPQPGADKVFSLLIGAGSAVVALAAAIILIGAVTVIIAGLPVAIPLRLHPTDRRFVEIFGRLAATPSASLLIWLTAWLVGVFLVFSGLFRRTPVEHLGGTLVIAAVGSWFWFAVMNPALAARESLKSFAINVAAIVPAHVSVGHVGLGDCELNFYSPYPLQPVLRPACQKASLPEYLVIRQRDFDAIAPARRACFKLVLQGDPDDSIGPRLLLKKSGS